MLKSIVILPVSKHYAQNVSKQIFQTNYITLIMLYNYPHGGLACESVGKADLLSDHFDGKQSRESVHLQLTSLALRSSEVRPLLLYLDPYGGSDPLGKFTLFLKRTVDVLAPHISALFSSACSSG